MGIFVLFISQFELVCQAHTLLYDCMTSHAEVIQSYLINYNMHFDEAPLSD